LIINYTALTSFSLFYCFSLFMRKEELITTWYLHIGYKITLCDVQYVIFPKNRNDDDWYGCYKVECFIYLTLKCCTEKFIAKNLTKDHYSVYFLLLEASTAEDIEVSVFSPALSIIKIPPLKEDSLGYASLILWKMLLR